MTVTIQLSYTEQFEWIKNDITDFATFATAGVGIACLLIWMIVTVCVRNYKPVVYKDIWNIVLSCIAASFFIVGTFISNSHGQEDIKIQNMACPVWTTWVRFFLGFGMWHSFVILRQTTFLWVIWGPDHLTRRAFGWVKVAILVQLSIPFLMVSIIGSLFNWSHIGQEGRCFQEPVEKISILIYSILLLCFISVLDLIINQANSRISYDYKRLSFIAKINIIYSSVFLFVWFFDLSAYPLARTLSTVCVIFSTLHYLFYVSGKEIYHGVRRTSPESLETLHHNRVTIGNASKIEDILTLPRIEEDFLLFCTEKSSEAIEEDSIYETDDEDSSEPVYLGSLVSNINLTLHQTVSNMVTFHKDITSWIVDHSDLSPDIMVKRAEILCFTYLDTKSRKFINIQRELIDIVCDTVKEYKDCKPTPTNRIFTSKIPKSSFDKMHKYIMDDLSGKYGQSYLSSIYKRPIYGELTHQKTKKTVTRREEFKQLTLYNPDFSNYYEFEANPD